MRLLLVICLGIQGCLATPSDDQDSSALHKVLKSLDRNEMETLVELLLRETAREEERQLSFENRKRQLLEDSAVLTQSMLEAERSAAQQHQMSDSAHLLRGFVKSSSYVQRVSQVARQQLKALSTFKKEWDASHGQGKAREFWQAVKRSELLSASSCQTSDDDELSANNCLDTRTIDSCPLADPDCTSADRKGYRTYDGSCNNEVDGQRAWGMAPTAQVRLLEPVYENGLDELRVTGDGGGVLPNARSVSKAINDRFVHTPATYSYMVMQFGQFLDHDITHTDASETTNEDGTTEDMYCGCELDPDSEEASECMNIEIPSDDPTAANRDSCMEVVRSAPWPEEDCENSFRQQVNSITAYIDCSQVYGSNRKLANRLRDSDTTRGRMATTTHPTHPEWKDLLPYLNTKEQRDDCMVDDQFCFLAGDDRRNVQPGLAAMHTVWVRMHNYIEENLFALNPDWTGEQLYQESRRVLIALTQHITYNEYIRSILGNRRMREGYAAYNGAVLNVDPDSADYANVYNDTVSANIINVFSTAGYRFGHSEINKYMKFLQQFAPANNVDCDDSDLDDATRPSYCVKLRDLYNNPSTIYESPANDGTTEVSGVDSVLLGIIDAQAERVDLWYTEEITDYLFTDTPSDQNTHGYDLFALNIQRGRDHGLPGYMAFREYFGLETSDDWSRQPEDFADREWERFQRVYKNPKDIDVYPGGLLERHSQGAKMGPLFREITAEQFIRIKIGDRFWYELGDMANSFTIDQLTQIRKFTLAGLLCATLDNPGMLPQWAFDMYDVDSDTNVLMACPQFVDDDNSDDTHPELDFTPWASTK